MNKWRKYDDLIDNWCGLAHWYWTGQDHDNDGDDEAIIRYDKRLMVDVVHLIAI